MIATFAITASILFLLLWMRWGHDRFAFPIFLRLVLFDDARSTAFLLVAMTFIRTAPRLGAWGAALADRIAHRPGLTALLAFVALALATRGVYVDHALSMDEYAARLQAHAFAQGQLGVDVDPRLAARVVPSQSEIFLHVDPASHQIYSRYWPGFALLMAPLAAVDLEGLLNPFLSALALVLMAKLATSLAGDRRAGGWAVLFALASPCFVVNGFSFYSMGAHLTCNLAFAWLLMQETWELAALAGLVGGLALVLHNPLPHLAFAAPWWAWLAARRARWPRLVALFAGYLPIGALLGVGWPYLLSTMGTAPACVAWSPSHAPAAMLAAYAAVLRLPDAFLLTMRVLATMKAWVWTMPGLFLLAACGLRRRADTPWFVLMTASLVGCFVVYLFVSLDQGHGWGYRFLHPAWGVVPVLAGASMGRRVHDDEEDVRWRVGVGGLAMASLAVMPVFLWQVHTNVVQSLESQIPPPADGRWVVFVAPQPNRYTGDLVQNLPGDERVLTLASLGDEADETWMRATFPGAERTTVDARGSLWRRPTAGASP